MERPPALEEVHHIAVKAREPALLASFYENILGLSVTQTWLDDQGALRSLWLKLGQTTLMVERSEVERAGPSSLPRFAADPARWHLVAFRIAASQREQWKAFLAAHRVPIVHESLYTLYVQDPEGNRVGLSHYPDPEPGGV